MTNLVDPTLPSPSATPGDDTISGTEFADILSAGDGNDTIEGLGGRDLLDGEAGSDTIIGGAGDDLLYGFDGDDSLDGGDGNDFLFGEFGEDTLTGGAGSDVLEGGGTSSESNVFFFGAGSGVDFVLDFVPGTDTLAIASGTAGITTAADALARVVADADGTAVLDLGQGNAVVLLGTAPAELTADDFSIQPADFSNQPFGDGFLLV